MINRGVTGIFVTATLATIFTVAATMSVLTTFPLGQQHEAAAQQNETTATMPTENQSTTSTGSNSKNFTLYNTEVQGLDDTYIYTLPVIAANSGDSVTVNFHNVAESGGAEDSTEGRHSFTLDTPPYNVDLDTAAGESKNATFTVDQQGIFQYHCKYHPETMRGQLIVLPPS